MDWGKAKSILIGVFIVLNIFLFAFLSRYYFGEHISDKTIQNTLEVLKRGGVTLTCSIPSYSGKDMTLTYLPVQSFNRKNIVSNLLGGDKELLGSGTEDAFTSGGKRISFLQGNQLTYRDNSPGDRVDLSSRNLVESKCKAYIKDLGLPVSWFSTDQYITDANHDIHVAFTEKYKGYKVFDNKVDFRVTDKGITSMECCYKTPGTIQSGAEIKPAYAVLLKHFAGKKGVVIEGMDLGFKSYSADKEKGALAWLVWRVKVQNSGERFFRALDGSEINFPGE